MNNDFLITNIKTIAQNIVELQDIGNQILLIENELANIRKHVNIQTNAIQLAVCTAIGFFESEETDNYNEYVN